MRRLTDRVMAITTGKPTDKRTKREKIRICRLTTKYKCESRKEKLGEPDYDNGWRRDIDCSLTTDILDDIKAMILNYVVYERRADEFLCSDIVLKTHGDP
jgi:hypothetical protein